MPLFDLQIPNLKCPQKKGENRISPEAFCTLLSVIVKLGLKIVHLEFWQERGAVNTVEQLYVIVQINPEG